MRVCALTFDAEAAGVQHGSLGGGDVDLQTEFLQRPAVGLGHVLAGGRDVGLRHKQTAQTHVDVLDLGGGGGRLGRLEKKKETDETY